MSTPSNQYFDQAAVVHYRKKIEEIKWQTDFRCKRFLTPMPWAEGEKGDAQRINRSFSEGKSHKLVGRFAPKVATSSPRYDARWMYRSDSVEEAWFDEKDIWNVLNDPMGKEAMRQTEMFNRTLDYDCVRAMFANVEIGPVQGQTTPTSFAADGGITIDMTAGATYEKLLEIIQVLIDGEVINDGTPQMYMSIDGTMNTEFLNELELTSSDYATRKDSATGEINGWGPIEFIRFGSSDTVPDPILPVEGGIRTGFVVLPGAMEYQVKRAMNTNVIKLDQTHRDTWAVDTTMSYGFMRLDARKIIKITTTA